jgi:threonine/homoserine/homoserine lactone efflux protein
MIPTNTSLLLFVSAALVLLAIPGPAVFYVTSRSIGHGLSAGGSPPSALAWALSFM